MSDEVSIAVEIGPTDGAPVIRVSRSETINPEGVDDETILLDAGERLARLCDAVKSEALGQIANMHANSHGAS